MEIIPMEEYRLPRYPDKQTALKDPLLLKSLPRRWAGKAFAITTLTAAVTLIISARCSDEDISPLYRRNAGRGGFGCESIAPPAYMTEAEASAVISELLESKEIQIQSSNRDRIPLMDFGQISTHLKPLAFNKDIILSETDLRAQVADFIAWLKAEKII